MLTVFLTVTILFLCSNYRDRTIVSCSMHWEQMSVLTIWCILFLSPHGSEKTEKGLLELYFISLQCSDKLAGSSTVHYDNVLQLSCSTQIIQRVIFLRSPHLLLAPCFSWRGNDLTHISAKKIYFIKTQQKGMWACFVTLLDPPVIHRPALGRNTNFVLWITSAWTESWTIFELR